MFCRVSTDSDGNQVLVVPAVDCQNERRLHLILRYLLSPSQAFPLQQNHIKHWMRLASTAQSSSQQYTVLTKIRDFVIGNSQVIQGRQSASVQLQQVLLHIWSGCLQHCRLSLEQQICHHLDVMQNQCG